MNGSLMNKMKPGFIFLLFLLGSQALFATNEVTDSVRTVTFYVKRDQQNVSDACEIILSRKGKKEKLEHAVDQFGYPCFFFEAGTREIIRTEIIHQTLGEIKLDLKCYWSHHVFDFFLPGEPYYYFLAKKQKLQLDSLLYRVSYGEIPYDENLLDVNDTILQLMKATGIPFTKERTGLFRFHSETDAVQMEQLLLATKDRIRLEPKIIGEDKNSRLESYLSNTGEVFFLTGTPHKQIRKIFRKLGIKNYSRVLPYRDGDLSYLITFTHAANRSYLHTLDRLWNKKEVYAIRQSVLNKTIYRDYSYEQVIPERSGTE